MHIKVNVCHMAHVRVLPLGLSALIVKLYKGIGDVCDRLEC